MLTIGTLVGTIAVTQFALVGHESSVAETAAVAAGTGMHKEQLVAYAGVTSAHAERNAQTTIANANIVIAAAQGKTDATALSASVAMLGNYTILNSDRVFALVDQTQANASLVTAATLEADRIAAEQAAAAAAAAVAAAAAQAAADAADAAARASVVSAQGPAVSSRPAAPTDPSGAQAIARDLMAAQYGWGDDQFGCLVSLWSRESGWNVNAYNASSGATGIPQAVPGSKMASAGADWQTNPATQITWGLGYIAGRYGTPCGAWDHLESAGWY
ncbi:aggregation-promoting factor C-terminal-like domain-containing protein [Glaciibacter psychrotolerans]|uniref:Lytic transglycosylase domain-containing protein n=1 Tax=Glaciibacter psychrotolerans TaxID=670054 RepID=A0A7Z0J4T5_9MICO|nr:lytic transglycosylase domain-containing protein [Leifsonia psychrotolerans]NYJ18727.1 hypothetical protein [Leifsonia psychrotolerans]